MSVETGYHYHQEHYNYNIYQNESSTAMSEDIVFYYVVMILHVVFVPVYLVLIGYFSYKLCVKPAKRKKMALVLGTFNHAVEENSEEEIIPNENTKKNERPTPINLMLFGSERRGLVSTIGFPRSPSILRSAVKEETGFNTDNENTQEEHDPLSPDTTLI